MPLRRASLLLVIALLAGSAQAVEIRFTAVRVEGAMVRTSLAIPGLVDAAAESRLLSGKTFEATIRIRLYRQRDHFPDAELLGRSLRISALYNAVTQEYLVNYIYDGKILESRTVRSFAELVGAAEKVENLAVFALDPTWSGKEMLLRARVFLGVEYVLGLIPNDRWTDLVSSPPFIAP